MGSKSVRPERRRSSRPAVDPLPRIATRKLPATKPGASPGRPSSNARPPIPVRHPDTPSAAPPRVDARLAPIPGHRPALERRADGTHGAAGHGASGADGHDRTGPRRDCGSAPDRIALDCTPIGRTALLAIQNDLAAEQRPLAVPPPARAEISTLGYEERRAERTEPRAPHGSAPAWIAIGEGTVGRETHAAIEQDLLAESVIAPLSHPELEPTVVESCRQGAGPAARRGVAIPMPIHELRTFVVDQPPASLGEDDDRRREFVETRLLFRLPALSMKEVSRIEISAGPVHGTSLITIWCRIPDRLG